MTGRRRPGPYRRLVALLVIALALQSGAAWMVGAWPRQAPGGIPAEDFPRFNPAGIDFAVVYVAARRVAAGQDPYRTYPDDLGKLELGQLKAPGQLDHVRQRSVAPGPPGWRNLYGPITAVVFLPLAGMEFPAAYRLMSAITPAALAASVAVLAAGLGLSAGPALLVAALGLTLLAGSYPVAFMLERGNWYSLVQLGIAVAMVLDARRRPVAAGAVLGVCAGLKVTPAGLAMAWLASVPVRWTALAGSLFAGACSVLVLGPERLREWLAVLAAHGSFVGVGNVNHSFTVFTLVFDRPHWWPFFIAASALAMVGLVRLQRVVSRRPHDPVLRAAAFSAPLPLLSLLPPISNDYNLTLLALPYLLSLLVIARVVASGRGWRRGLAAVAGVALVANAALLVGAPIPAPGRWALLVWQKTLQVMGLQVLVLAALGLALTAAPRVLRLRRRPW
jgi:hypothetical protein